MFPLSFKKPILSANQLRRLDQHKYSSQSVSLLDNYFQIWWNFVVSYVPLWVAPNLITIVGLILNVGTSLLLMYYCPNGREEPPFWIPLSCGLGLFIYQTLDAIDGKQARRTGTNSPLGELFDHGCDSISTVFVSIASACCVGLGDYPNWMMFQSLCASSLFYCAHWQTYVTGTMRFGTIDVTEGQICVIFIMLLTSVFGSVLWSYELFGIIPLRLGPTLFGVSCGLFSLVGTLSKIMQGGAGRNGSTVAGTSVLTPIIPLGFVIVPAIIIASKSEEALYENSPILYIMTFGLIASKITNKLVVAHMTKSEMHYIDSSLLAPLALFFNQYFNTFLPEKPLLCFGFVYVLLDLIFYCYKVCLEICNHMNVFLFKITPQSSKPVNSLATSSPSSRNGNSNKSRSGSASRVTRSQTKNSSNSK